MTLTSRCSPPESPTDGRAAGFGHARPRCSRAPRARAARRSPSAGRPVLSFESIRATRSSSTGGQVRPELPHARRLFAEHLGEHRDHVGARRTRAPPSGTRRARSRARRRRCERRGPGPPSPARGSCTRPCRGSSPVRVMGRADGRVAGELRAARCRSRAASPARGRRPTRKTLLGFTSRWTTPRACAAASPSATRRTTVRLSATLRPERPSRWARSSPSSHSIARNGWPCGGRLRARRSGRWRGDSARRGPAPPARSARRPAPRAP